MNSHTTVISQKAERPSSQTIIRAAAAALLVSSAGVAIDAAHAQDGVTWLDTIAVVGTRTATSVQDNPASVTVVDEEQIARKSGESIADMLRDVPGVQVVDASAPGMKRLSIRGESSRRVTILVDGQEITDHSTYGTPLLIDPSGVERIEVVRGPASVQHGAKAIGGVVNIITKRGADKPVQVELGGTYYSGTAGWQGWGAASGTVGNFDYRISGSLDDHGDRYVPEGRYTATGRLDGTSFGNDNISAHLGYTFGEAGNHYIALKATQHRLWTENWTDWSAVDYPATKFNIDLPKRDLRKVGVYYDGTDISDVVRKVHFDAYYQEVDRLFANQLEMRPLGMMGPTITVESTSDDVNVNYGGTAQMDLQFHPDHYTIIGLQYLMDDLRAAKTSDTRTNGMGPGPRPSLNEASIGTVSAFAQNEWSFAEDFKLTTGLRYYYSKTSHDRRVENSVATATHPDNSDGRLVTSAGLTYSGIQDTTLRALYSEGYITPTLLQMFTDTSAGSGSTTYGNPNLRPETSRNIEIGARYNSGGLVLDGTAFYSQARDYITSGMCPTVVPANPACPTGQRTYLNADRATTYGLELAAEYTIPGTAFTPYASGTWMRRHLEFTGIPGGGSNMPSFDTYSTNTPALSGRFGLRWEGEVANHNTWVDLYVRAGSSVKSMAWRAKGPPPSYSFVTSTLPAWGTLNLAFGGSFGGEDDDRFRYAVHFNNILNKEYRSSFDEIPGIGRSIEVSLRMKF